MKNKKDITLWASEAYINEMKELDRKEFERQCLNIWKENIPTRQYIAGIDPYKNNIDDKLDVWVSIEEQTNKDNCVGLYEQLKDRTPKYKEFNLELFKDAIMSFFNDKKK